MLVPAFLIAGIGMVYVYSEAQQVNRQNMREIARALALVVGKEMARRETILQTQGTSHPDIGDLDTFYVQARRLAPIFETSIMLSVSPSAWCWHRVIRNAA